MKKLLLAVIVAVAGLAIARRVRSDRAEQELWAEATDPVR